MFRQLLRTSFVLCSFLLSTSASSVTGTLSYPQDNQPVHLYTATPPVSIVVPLKVQEYNGFSSTVYFGVHSNATRCIDVNLGEYELPPVPPSSAFDVRLVSARGYDSCTGQGQILDVRQYRGTQTDTFLVKFQPGSTGTYPLTFSWPLDLGVYFGGAVTLQDVFGGVFVNVNMKTQQSYVLTLEAINQLYIIASNPFSTSNGPIVQTEGWSVSVTTASLTSRIVPNGLPTSAWFEWGETESLGYTTPTVDVGNSETAILYVDSIRRLQPNATYYFRAVASNSAGTAYGGVKKFITAGVGTLLPFSLTVSNSAADSAVLTFGYADSATYCVDDFLGEQELPPIPPVEVLDVRFRDHRAGNPFCLGEGVQVNYHPFPALEKCDTFLIIFQPGGGGYPVRLGWPAGLGNYFNSIHLVDLFGGILHNVDMTTAEELHVTNSAINRLYIIACPKSFGELPPVATTKFAEERGWNSAQLYGSVVTYGTPTQVWFEWGTSPAYGNVTSPQTIEGGFFEAEYVDELNGLERNTVYHFRAVAENIFGVSYGENKTFTLPAGPPVVRTESVEEIGQNAVRIYGSVSTNGDATEAWFEWGTSPSYGNVTTRQYFEGPFISTLFSDDLINLEENTTYHFRAVAENNFGVSYGENMTFTITRGLRSHRIPLYLSDLILSDSLVFGIDPEATFCLDYGLGEAELAPPPPMGIFDVRFANPRFPTSGCFGGGTKLDLRPPVRCFPERCTQVDTYLVKFQKSFEAGNEFYIQWPDLHPYYYGPVLLIYGNSITDMMQQNSVILNASISTYFFIIAADSFRVTPPPPPPVNAYPFIYSVRDIPFDQGGRVSVRWNASLLDVEEHIIEFYSIWRATPEFAKVSSPLITPKDVTFDFKGVGHRLIPMNGQEYAWEFVGTQAAHQFAHYAYTAPTLYDSMPGTDGKHYFLVSAHTANPDVFYDSNVDSGYSVDNIVPTAPRNLTAEYAVGVYLRWDPSPDQDLSQYLVFFGENENFDIGSAHLVRQTTESSVLIIPGPERLGYYAVCAQDIHGNISDKSNEVPNIPLNVIPSKELPKVFALTQNYPNPFNPTTTFNFDLPQEGFVSLKVFNPLGQEVRTLVNSHYAAGRHNVDFDATGLRSGVYFYQLNVISQETGSVLFRDVKKFLLLK